MTYQSVEDFLNVVRAENKGDEVDVVLIIGFDGGSVLLNHPKSKIVWEEMVGGSPAKVVPGDFRKLEQKWRRYSASARRSELKRYTSAPIGGVNRAAVDCIAGLLKDGFVNTIVMTDVGKSMFQALRARGVEIESYAWGPARLDICKNLRRKGGRVKYLIDGEDLLLLKFQPTCWELEQDGVVEMRSALGDFLATFDRIYCWGWGDLNVQLDKILPASGRGAYQLYLLGEYTEERPLDEISPIRVSQEDGSGDRDESMVNPMLLYAIADGLELERFVADSSPASAETAVEPGRPSRPIVPAEALLEIAGTMESAEHQQVVVIGVDGELARQGAARFLQEALRGQSGRSRAISRSELGAISRYLTLHFEQGGSGDIVALASGVSPPVEGWQDQLDRQLTEMAGAIRESSSRIRVVLLVPAVVSQWVYETICPRYPLFRSQSFFVSTYLTVENLAGWLVERLRQYVGVSEHLDAGRVAEIMIADCGNQHPADADWLLEAIDLWHDRVIQSIAVSAPENGVRPSLGGVTMEQSMESWHEINQAYHNNWGRIALDFPMSIMHREGTGPGSDAGGAAAGSSPGRGTARPADGEGESPPSIEFELGPIKRRKTNR